MSTRYFAPNSGQVMAIMNVIKTIIMSVMIFIASFVYTQKGFRWYFGFQIVANVLGQLMVLTKFDFEIKED
jgi:hypothetical protein